MNRYVLVLSDAHLAPAIESERLPFRSAAFSPASHLSRTIDQAVDVAQRDHGALEIILAGDVFDFDVAQTATEANTITRQIDTRSVIGACDAFTRIRASHLPFFLALRRALQAGATVVILPGNHDAQLGFLAIQELLRASLSGVNPSNLLFRPWYYLAAGGAVHVEHGHQYDPLCSVSRLLPSVTGPTTPASGLGVRDHPPHMRVESTVGTVSSFYAPLLLPGMDPFVMDPFMERRSLRSVLSTLPNHGSSAALFACARELLEISRPSAKSTPDHACDLGVEEGHPWVDARRALFASKASIYQVFAAYTGVFDYGRSVEAATAHAMTVASNSHGAKVVVVGHTHHPGVSPLPNGATLLNSGSWTPRRTREEPVGSFAWIVTDAHGQVYDASVKQVVEGDS